jgi:hypothetical protein
VKKRRKARAVRQRATVPAVIAPPPAPLTWQERAIERGLNADQIGAIAKELERQDAYNSRLKFDNAWAQAQMELPVVLRTKEVAFPGKREGSKDVSYRYAPYDEIVAAVRPILGKFGLGFSQSVTSSNGTVTVSTGLIGFGHREPPSVHTFERDETGGKNRIQGAGSAQTYAQRYTLLAALGLATADDDDAANAEVEPAISPEQADALKAALLQIVEKDPGYTARVLAWAQSQVKRIEIKSIDDIRASQFDYVHQQILRKKARMAQGSPA